VLVLHGGKEASMDPVRRWQPSVARLIPFARAIHRRTAHEGVATWRLRYRYRGWNGNDASPVDDARWALDEVRHRHGDVPVVLLGHSMGGRTALRVADDPAVHTVVALAPWLPVGEPVAAVACRRVVVAHGDQDRRTSPEASHAWLVRAGAVADQTVYLRVRGGGHALLRRAGVWTSLATTSVLGGLREIPLMRHAGSSTPRGIGEGLSSLGDEEPSLTSVRRAQATICAPQAKLSRNI
jgi:pimeloyl-ACP methyl ester carboxylesterase